MANSKKSIASLLIILLPYLIITILALNILLPYHVQLLTLACINIILAVSLNLITGFTGQFSLGHGGFLAIGAYLSATLTVFFQLSFYPSLLLASAVSALAGILIGLPTLRLKGDYLAIATLGFGEIIRVIILNTPKIGGPRGFTGIPRLTTFGTTYFIMVATVVIISNFINSAYGRACVGIKEDEIAAGALGINTTYYKIVAFALGAAFPGVAGALYAHYLQFISPAPGQIGFLRSVDILMMVVLGGQGNIAGSIIAAILFTFLPEFLRGFAEYRMLVYPFLLLITMLFRPGGLLGEFELSFELLEKGIVRLKRGEVGHNGSDKGFASK